MWWKIIIYHMNMQRIVLLQLQIIICCNQYGDRNWYWTHTYLYLSIYPSIHHHHHLSSSSIIYPHHLSSLSSIMIIIYYYHIFLLSIYKQNHYHHHLSSSYLSVASSTFIILLDVTLFWRLGSAFFSNSINTIFSCPFTHALWRGVSPYYKK